jgi:hypothetical protein
MMIKNLWLWMMIKTLLLPWCQKMIIMREQVLLARSVFTPTASLIQQVASCLHIINTREMARYKQKEYQADSTVSGLGDSAVKKSAKL